MEKGPPLRVATLGSVLMALTHLYTTFMYYFPLPLLRSQHVLIILHVLFFTLFLWVAAVPSSILHGDPLAGTPTLFP